MLNKRGFLIEGLLWAKTWANILRPEQGEVEALSGPKELALRHEAQAVMPGGWDTVKRSTSCVDNYCHGVMVLRASVGLSSLLLCAFENTRNK